jgi:Tfp pilus assembly protein FimT
MSSRGRHSEHGVTMLEILVTLAIVMTVSAGLAFGYRRLPSTVLRRESAHLAAVLQAGYDHASAANTYHRMIIDLDQRSYHLERCEGTYELHRSADQREEARRAQEEEERRRQEKAAAEAGQQTPEQAMAAIQQQLGTAGQTYGGGAGGTGTAACGPMKGEMGKPHVLPDSPKVMIPKVWVGHLDDPVTEGKVTLGFFPFGRAERAVVELTAGDPDGGHTWSVVLHPIDGRVVVTNREYRQVNEFMTEDAEGKRIAQ